MGLGPGVADDARGSGDRRRDKSPEGDERHKREGQGALGGEAMPLGVIRGVVKAVRGVRSAP